MTEHPRCLRTLALLNADGQGFFHLAYYSWFLRVSLDGSFGEIDCLFGCHSLSRAQ